MNKTIKNKAYWEAKHPVVDQLYNGRPLPGTRDETYPMDIRHFFWPDDITLRKVIADNKLQSNSCDETVLRIQRWVVKNLKYVSDSKLGCPEYWLYSAETLELMNQGMGGDCEDGMILIASLCYNALPIEEHWRIRGNAGWVQSAPTAPQGGHGYVSYFRQTDNEAVPIDWCYFENSNIPVAEKVLLRNRLEYKDIWFSFSYYKAWSHVSFECRGRLARSGKERITG